MQNIALNAIKQYLRWKYGSQHPALAAKLKRVKPPRQRVLTMEKAQELLAMFDPHTPKGARDLALAALALDTGLRASELARLTPANLDMEERSLSVIVKGGQWKTAVYSEATANCINKWLAYRDENCKTLFYSLHHRNKGNEMKRDGMRQLVNEWGRRLNIKLSPHDLRRSFATLATILGAPTRIVQVAGRWEKLETVEKYTRDIDQRNITPYLPTSHLIKK